MRWSEIEFEAKTWVIPSDRSKNGKAHVVPLSAFAFQMLDEVPRFLDCDYVFTSTRKSPRQRLFEGLASPVGRLENDGLALA